MELNLITTVMTKHIDLLSDLLFSILFDIYAYECSSLTQEKWKLGSGPKIN